jgi:hypothetical protein
MVKPLAYYRSGGRDVSRAGRSAERPDLPYVARALGLCSTLRRCLIQDGERVAACAARVAADRLRDSEPEARHHSQRQHVLLRQVVDDVIVGDHRLIEQLVGHVLPDADDRHRVVTDDCECRIDERPLCDVADRRAEQLGRRCVSERLST